MRQKTSYRELSAGEIKDEVLLILKARNCEVWRQNNIAVRGRKFTGKKGLSDIQGYVKSTGVAVYAEMTSPPSKGCGCHECGYTGKRRNVTPVPAIVNGKIVKIKPQSK